MTSQHAPPPPPPYYNPESLRPFLVDPDPALLRLWISGLCDVQAHVDTCPQLRQAYGLGDDFRELLDRCVQMPVPYGVYALLVYLLCTQAARDKLPPADVRFMEHMKHEWGVWATGRHQRTGAMYTAADAPLGQAHTVAFALSAMSLYRTSYQHSKN